MNYEKRIAHKFDPQYFDYVCRNYRYLVRQFIPEREVIGLENLTKLQGSPLVVFPRHKSLHDFLDIGLLFWENGIEPPRFAAGENLFFSRFDPIWRRLGAFAIDRWNKDRKYWRELILYTRKLVNKNETILDFSEGARAESGEILKKKEGLLGVILQAAKNSGMELNCLPMDFQYTDRVEDGYLATARRFREMGYSKLYKATDCLAFLMRAMRNYSADVLPIQKKGKLKIKIASSFSMGEIKNKEELALRLKKEFEMLK
jgi:glycerol-3-phosphate O-acyltransferase